MTSNGGNFLPGPVALSPAVEEAYRYLPRPHRSVAADMGLRQARGHLRSLTGAAHVAILFGSGTLANDAIACHLRNLGRGVILTNGEFGERLLSHAIGWDIDYSVIRQGWGEPLHFDGVENARPDWIWAVHCETSTGTLNDLGALKALAGRCGAKLILDCVSSIGAVPLDLSDVFLASGVSGKALCAPAGLAFVFAQEAIDFPAPVYLDLSRYWNGAPFTLPVNLVAALNAALEGRADDHFERVADAGLLLKQVVASAGLSIVGDRRVLAPHVVTVRGSADLAGRLAARGILCAWESGYLRRREWMQFALMGCFDEGDIGRLAEALADSMREAA